jgi:hypothetical protein
MTEKCGTCGRRQARGQFPVARKMAARCGAIATFAVLILSVNAAPISGAPDPIPSLSGASVGPGSGSEGLRAPLRQSTTNVADPETPTDSGATSEASRMAAIVAVVNRQGVQGAKNLQRVSAIAVPNLMPEPEFVIDARAERAAEANAAATAAAIAATDEANAAATAAAVAATEVALSVQATVEAQDAEAASKAMALAAIQEAEAEVAASATAAAITTETTRDSAAEAAAALAAKQEARIHAVEVAATRNAETLAAAAVASNPKMPDRMSSLLIALTPMLGAVLGFRLWRSRKEPFVLKANPIPARSSASA